MPNNIKKKNIIQWVFFFNVLITCLFANFLLYRYIRSDLVVFSRKSGSPGQRRAYESWWDQINLQEEEEEEKEYLKRWEMLESFRSSSGIQKRNARNVFGDKEAKEINDWFLWRKSSRQKEVTRRLSTRIIQ